MPRPRASARRPSRKSSSIRRPLILLAVPFAISCGPPATAVARTDCESVRCDERVAAKQCSQKRVLACIRRAAIHYRVSYSMLVRKARCESKLDPLAARGPHAGLFQFRISGTWATTPYARRSPWRAKWNALAAAWMHHVGRGGEWTCR
jgi:hypothetical protein